MNIVNILPSSISLAEFVKLSHQFCYVLDEFSLKSHLLCLILQSFILANINTMCPERNCIVDHHQSESTTQISCPSF